MKRFSVLLACAVTIGILLAGCNAPKEPEVKETLANGDRDFLLSALHASRKQFLDSVEGLSEAQWTYKPNPERWSIAQVAEHVTKTEGFLFGMVQDDMLKGESKSATTTREDDEKFLAMLRDRSEPQQAPAPVRPDRRWADRQALLAEFRSRRDQTLKFARETEIPLRNYPAKPEHPAKDAYQGLLMLAGHLERHVAQIEEVKADPKFPK